MLTDTRDNSASRTLRSTRIQSGIVESGNGSSSDQSGPRVDSFVVITSHMTCG